MEHLESDLLRTFLAVADAGSVSAGGTRINRSQSATSLQVQRLEAIVGRPLFERHGRGMVLTAAGEQLRPVAQRVTQSLDHILADLRGTRLTGRLRIGLPEEQERSSVAGIIAEFAASHPDVELEIHSALGSGFADDIEQGRLDLAVFEVPDPRSGDEVLGHRTLLWVRSRDLAAGPGDVLPIALLERDCWWRDAALAMLDDNEIRYRIVFTSEGAGGVWSCVDAGIAAGLLGTEALSRTVVPVEQVAARCASHIVLRRARGAVGPACEAMVAAIRRAFV